MAVAPKAKSGFLGYDAIDILESVDESPHVVFMLAVYVAAEVEDEEVFLTLHVELVQPFKRLFFWVHM